MSEIISSVEEAITALREKLPDYLTLKLGITNFKKPFACPFHNDGKKPNMVLNPKSDNQVAHCFSCSKTADIFEFANQIDNLPASGPDWIKETLPTLCNLLGIKLQLGEQTEAQKLRAMNLRFLQDTTDILIQHQDLNYIKSRNWNEDTIGGSIELDKLISLLISKGWEESWIKNNSLLFWNKRDINDCLHLKSLFSEEKYTFPILDLYKKPIGFITRWKKFNTETHTEKYLHSLNNIVFDKSKSFFGFPDIKQCKDKGVYLFEGPGEIFSCLKNDMKNCLAVMGTAITENHFLELKKIGITKVVICLDFDNAGQEATERIIDNVIPKVQGLSISIKTSSKTDVKDPDDYINKYGFDEFIKEKEISVFEYKLRKLAVELDSENLCKQMIPFIAAEVSAIKRSLLTKQLSEYTTIIYAAIEADVEAYRNLDVKERRTSIVAAGESLLSALQTDPENAISLIGTFERDVEKIEKRFNKSALGVNFQLQRYRDLQTLRTLSTEDEDAATFTFKYFTEFSKNFSGGMPLTRGCLIYAAGRANSGKTLSCLALGADVALYDNKAMTIVQTMDDSYEQIEPRLKTNIYNMYYNYDFHLTLDMVVSPWKYKDDDRVKEALNKANQLFIDLLGDERLVILDANDGANLTTFERNLRYYRNRYPSRKLLAIQDNTHDLQDFPNLDQTTRMKQISASQKGLTNKYEMCLLATTEYRKAPPQASTKMILPTNDDIADSRSMSYKPNIIFHVYNDLADRADNAEIFWQKDGKKMPRLIWVVSKNKINSFKGWMVNDIDPSAVMLIPKTEEEASNEWDQSHLPEENKQEMKSLDDDLSFEVETEWNKED